MSELPPGIAPAPGPAAGPASPLHAAATDVRRSGRARPPSQAAMFVVVALGQMMFAAAAGELGWGIALALATALGVGVGIASDADRWLRVPGWLLAPATVVLASVLVALALEAGVPLPYGTGLLFGAVALGLDWTRIDALRSLPFWTGLIVLLALLSDETWVFPVGIVWVALAFGALSLLEADRRASQPRAQPALGVDAPKPRLDDLATSVLIAVAVALVAALVLSVPACQRQMSEGGSGQGSDLGEGTGTGGASGQAGSGSSSGSGQPGSGQPGSDELAPGGLEPGSAAPGGGVAEHRYVPNPDGRFLVPPSPDEQAEPPEDDGRAPIPLPEQLPPVGEDGTGSQRFDGGITVEVTEQPGGALEVEVQRPGAETRRFRYFERSDGLIQIDELGEGNQVRDTWFYDPEGVIVDGTPADVPPPAREEPPKDPGEGFRWPSWRAVLLVLVLLAGVGALIWWLLRRSDPPSPPDAAPAPPWALALAARLEEEGAARGRVRGGQESVVAYARALADGPLPVPDVEIVGEIVSAALFGRADPGPEAQRWAEAALAAALDAHPVGGIADEEAVAAR